MVMVMIMMVMVIVTVMIMMMMVMVVTMMMVMVMMMIVMKNSPPSSNSKTYSFSCFIYLFCIYIRKFKPWQNYFLLDPLLGSSFYVFITGYSSHLESVQKVMMTSSKMLKSPAQCTRHPVVGHRATESDLWVPSLRPKRRKET